MFLDIKQTKDTGVVVPCVGFKSAVISYFLKKSLISSLKSVTRIEITAINIIKTSILVSKRLKSTHTPNLIAKKKARISEENRAYQNLDRVAKPFIHLAKWIENYTIVRDNCKEKRGIYNVS